jgi:WD40 repeat protein
VRALRGHGEGISDVHFDARGARLLTASSDGTGRLWRTDGETLAILRGHTQHVYKAVWSPDDRFIATASQDSSIRLWEASTGRLLTIISTHNNAVWDVAFSPGGAYLMSGSEDGTAHIYACDVCTQTDSLLVLARERITRTPTDLEARTFGL